MAIGRGSQEWPEGEAVELTRDYGLEMPERTLVERVIEVVDWHLLLRLRGKLCRDAGLRSPQIATHAERFQGGAQ